MLKQTLYSRLLPQYKDMLDKLEYKYLKKEIEEELKSTCWVVDLRYGIVTDLELAFNLPISVHVFDIFTKYKQNF